MPEIRGVMSSPYPVTITETSEDEYPEVLQVKNRQGYTVFSIDREGVIYSQEIVSLKAFGAVGDGVTDDTDAINAWLAAVALAGVGTIPKGRFLTDGGHIVPPGCAILGSGAYESTFLHRGATYCFRLMDESSPSISGRISNLSIEGSDGTLPAVAGGIGIEISNGIRSVLDGVSIYGFTNSGIGILFHNVPGSLEFVEQSSLYSLGISNCSTLIKFKVESGSGTSFGYMNLLDIQMQIYANQTAIEVAGGTLYNSRILGQLHYTGNSGTGLKVSGTGSVWQGTWLDIRGELLDAYTGCKRIDNDNNFSARGTFFIANGEPPDDYAGSVTHQFVEDNRTDLELPQANIASATAIVVPAGRDAWNVTGTTDIWAVDAPKVWEGRTITLKFASAVTVKQSAGIKLAGGVDFVASANDTLTLTFISSVWYEVSRSIN